MLHPSSSTNTHTNHIPISPSYYFELYYIKALYLCHRYKDCIRRCEELLLQGSHEPAHIVFLNFYSALCHESLAKVMHVYSVFRLPEICAAESAYTKALEACSHKKHPRQQTSDASKSVQFGSPYLHHDETIVFKGKNKPSVPSLGPGVKACSLKHIEQKSSRINFSWPRTFSPLASDTVKAIQHRVTGDMTSSLEDPFVATTPSSQVSGGSMSRSTASPSASSAIADDDEDSSQALPLGPNTALTSPTPSRYVLHLRNLRLQLQHHQAELLTLKQETMTSQNTRTQRRTQTTASSQPKLVHSRSFWSFKDPEAERKEMKARIDRGRKAGWNWERFDPKKYARLAKDAVAELEA